MKTTLLAADSPDDAEIKEKKTGCALGEQYGHKSQNCPNMKTTLLFEDSPDDVEIKEKMTHCTLGELGFYHEHHIADHDYSDDYYKMPLPDSSDTVWGELLGSLGE